MSEQQPDRGKWTEYVNRIGDLQRDLAAAQRELQEAIEDRMQIGESLVKAGGQLAAAQATAQSEGKMREALADDVIRLTKRAAQAERERDAAQARVGELEQQYADAVDGRRAFRESFRVARAELAAEREANAVLGEVIRNERAEASALRGAVERLVEQFHKVKFHADQFSDDAGSSWWCVGLIVTKALEIAAASQEPAPDHIGDANKMVAAPDAREAVVDAVRSAFDAKVAWDECDRPYGSSEGTHLEQAYEIAKDQVWAAYEALKAAAAAPSDELRAVCQRCGESVGASADGMLSHECPAPPSDARGGGR